VYPFPPHAGTVHALVAVITRLETMGTHSPSHNDSHPTALAAGIPLRQSFPELRAGSMSAPVQPRLLGRRGLGSHPRADHGAR
jgi:hypothetical protein